MNIKCLFCLAMAIGLFLAAGCATRNTSPQPWDKPMQPGENPTYNTPDLTRPPQ